MPTVTEVLKRLSERGFIKYEPYGYVRTTEKGKEYAEALYRKHEVLRVFLMDVLGLSKERAEEEGCLMEHHLSKDTIRRIQKLTETLKEKGIRVEGVD